MNMSQTHEVHVYEAFSFVQLHGNVVLKMITYIKDKRMKMQVDVETSCFF